MTPSRLKEIEELANAATDGDWYDDLSRCSNCGGVADNGHDRCDPPSAYFCKRCEAFPELVAEIRRLREVLAWYGDNYNNYKYDVTKHDPAFDCAIDEDGGQRARDAIGGVDVLAV
jgi:hypothetical protein